MGLVLGMLATAILAAWVLSHLRAMVRAIGAPRTPVAPGPSAQRPAAERGAIWEGWRYMPEVVLAGLAGADLWVSSSAAGDLPWVLVAPCAALAIGATAVLSAGPRRLTDLGAACAISTAVVAAMPLSVFYPLFALLSPMSVMSLGAAAGAALGHAAERVGPWRAISAARVRTVAVGGAAGAGIAALLLCLSLWSPERHPTVASLGGLLFVLTFVTMPPVAAASAAVIAFLSHRAARSRSRP